MANLAEKREKILVITNIAPLYRKILWLSLLENKKFEFHFYFGLNMYSGIKTIDFTENSFSLYQNRIHQLKNKFLQKKRLVWQSDVIYKIVTKKFSSAIVTGDMNILSNWIIIVICKLRNKKVTLWSHGLYGNESKIKEILRTTFFKLADHHLLYERRGKDMMINAGFEPEKLHVVFNSLDYALQLKLRERNDLSEDKNLFSFFSNLNLPSLIFIGRLTQIKKIDLLLNAVYLLNKKANRLNVIIVGEGDAEKSLKELAQKGIDDGFVHFYGTCYDEERLSTFISNADLCVSPGNVGLTAIHSLSYGTPVCTHNNLANQMPEVQAIKEGYNGIFFKENDVNSLATSIHKWVFENKKTRKQIKKNCFEVIDTFYNTNYQTKVIENLLNNKKPLL